jgi:hypothetical protein
MRTRYQKGQAALPTSFQGQCKTLDTACHARDDSYDLHYQRKPKLHVTKTEELEAGGLTRLGSHGRSQQTPTITEPQ